MSYQVLARKYRPSIFAEVAGQAHVLKSLINALDNQRLHHAYLFTGTRGVGKTTLARILARCLNCEVGVSSTPCGECGACQEIAEGRFIDLIEVDAASRTKVEDTRELLENVQYLPSRGRYKVYLIDEVHMLSTHSFNALLKTLEEPPEHVKFLLATTDPQKLPITVLSRCLQFNLKNLAPQVIAEFVAGLLVKEDIPSETEALWQIAMAASGSMRDALTLTDQAISFCEGRVGAEGVTEMLGVPPQQQIHRLLEAMATRDVEPVLALIKEIGEQTPDYQHSLDALLSMLHRVAIAQASPAGVDNSSGDLEKVTQLASELSAEDVQLYYQIGLKGREDLRLALEMRSAFEMVLLRMLVFSPNFIAPAGEKKKTLAPADSAAPPAVSPGRPRHEIAVEANAPGEAAAPKIVTSEIDQAEAQNTIVSPAAPTQREAGAAQQIPESQLTADAEWRVGDPLTQENWVLVFPHLGLTGLSANILANSQFVQRIDDTLSFTLGSAHSAVFGEEAGVKVEPAFEQLLGEKLRVVIRVGETERETPAERKIRSNQEAQADRVEAFKSDPFVIELAAKFGATVQSDTIEQANPPRES